MTNSTALHESKSTNESFIDYPRRRKYSHGHRPRDTLYRISSGLHDRGGDVTFLSHYDSETLRQRTIDEGFDFIPIDKPHPDPDDLSSTLKVLSAINHQLQAFGLSSTATTHSGLPEDNKRKLLQVRACGGKH